MLKGLVWLHGDANFAFELQGEILNRGRGGNYEGEGEAQDLVVFRKDGEEDIGGGRVGNLEEGLIAVDIYSERAWRPKFLLDNFFPCGRGPPEH
jgi:hypothetical protein